MKKYQCPELKLVTLSTEDIVTASIVENVGTIVSFMSGMTAPGFEDESGM